MKRPKTNFEVRDGKVCLGSAAVSPDYLDVVRHLDAGANGAVFEARDTRLERTVAVKLWHPSVVVRQPDRALAETRKNASIDHPYFVTVHDCGVVGGVPYMVMQLVRGQSAKSWLSSNPAFEKRYAVWQGFEHGIRFAYSQGKLHGDPHTGNILIPDGATSAIDETGRVAVKLADMGTSRLRKSQVDYVTRECRVLKETCERLFLENRPDALLDERAWQVPQITLDALDTYVELLHLFRRIAKSSDDYQLAGAAISLSAGLFRVPLFKLDAVWQHILHLGVDATNQSVFLGHIKSEPLPDSKHSWTTTPMDPIHYPQVLARYQSESALWWQAHGSSNLPSGVQ